MIFNTLDQFRSLKEILTVIHKNWLRLSRGIHVPRSVKLSLSAKLGSASHGHISVGEYTLIAFKTVIYTRIPGSAQDLPVKIGSNCFIGGGSLIAPGVSIGDQCIVGAGSVVLDDVPSHTIVVGNPARAVRQSVELGEYGVLPVAKENTEQFWRL